MIVDSLSQELADLRTSKIEKSQWGILGISLGGMVALELASRQDLNFAQVILINSSLGALSSPLHRLRLSAAPKLLTSAGMTPRDREKAILSVTCNDAKTRQGILTPGLRQLPGTHTRRVTFLDNWLPRLRLDPNLL